MAGENMQVIMASEPPPDQSIGAVRWAKENLFSSPLNTILTVVTLAFIVVILRVMIQFVFVTADWEVVTTNLTLFAIGQYPRGESWRVIVSMGVVVVLALATAVGWGRQQNIQRALGVLWFLSPLIIIYLLRGGFGLLEPVRTQLWSGLLLTVMLTVVGIVASFPLGLLLALGRRSDMPIVKAISTTYIEVVRGVPLISILFMAQVMLPLFVPISIDVVLRAMGGVTLFSAAYLAEIIRGGLQAVSKGQVEAAQALGMNTIHVTSLIVLPQAIRIVIPAIVGQFISLFKDTSLVSIITLLDLLGITEAALAQDPSYQSHKIEAYLFVAVVYFVLSYVMSQGARSIESSTAAMGGTRRL